MSCSRCNCNPCNCATCDPANESAISIMNNMVENQIGIVIKTCEDGKVVWSLPCDLDTGSIDFPRLDGESIDCYFLRYLEFLASGGSGAQPLCSVLTSLCSLGYPAIGELLGSNGSGGLAWNSLGTICDYVTQLCALTLVKGDILYVDAGGALERLPIDSNGKYLTNVGGIPAYQSPPTIGGAFLMEEEQASGVDGGTFTTGDWRTRTLNSIVGDPSSLIVSLIANQFVLIAGTYLLTIKCPAYKVNTHQARLFNVTDGVAIHYSNYGIEAQGENDGGYAIIDTLFTILAAKTLRVEHRCQTTEINDGFGLAPGAFWTAPSIYTTVSGLKIA